MTPSSLEVRRFLARSMVVRLATLSPKGTPLLTPIWFVSGGTKLYIPTGRGALAVRNIDANPEVVALLHAENSPGESRVLRLRGRAIWSQRRPPPRLLLRFARKYYLCLGGLRSELRHVRQWTLRQRYYAQGGDAALIEVEYIDADFVPLPTS